MARLTGRGLNAVGEAPPGFGVQLFDESSPLTNENHLNCLSMWAAFTSPGELSYVR